MKSAPGGGGVSQNSKSTKGKARNFETNRREEDQMSQHVGIGDGNEGLRRSRALKKFRKQKNVQLLRDTCNIAMEELRTDVENDHAEPHEMYHDNTSDALH